MVERGRGVLTTRQREFVENEIDDSGPRVREMRSRIRRHIWDSLLDLNLLAQRLPEKDFEQLSVYEDDAEYPHPTPKIAAGVVGFVTRLLANEHAVERVVANGIEQGFRENGWNVNATVTIEIEGTVSGMLDQLENEGVESLSESDLKDLHAAGAIDLDEYVELYSQLVEENRVTEAERKERRARNVELREQFEERENDDTEEG